MTTADKLLNSTFTAVKDIVNNRNLDHDHVLHQDRRNVNTRTYRCRRRYSGHNSRVLAGSFRRVRRDSTIVHFLGCPLQYNELLRVDILCEDR